MKCPTCIFGAPADGKGEYYYCTEKGGTKKMSESRRDYLERCKVKANAECEKYIKRGIFMP